MQDESQSERYLMDNNEYPKRGTGGQQCEYPKGRAERKSQKKALFFLIHLGDLIRGSTDQIEDGLLVLVIIYIDCARATGARETLL